MLNPPQEKVEAVIRLYHSGDMVRAGQSCRQLLDSYPESMIVLSVYGAVLMSQNSLQDAVKIFDQLLQLQPGAADAWSNRSAALMGLGMLQQALQSVDKALALQPGFAGAHYNRGLVLQRMGRLEEAVGSYDRAIENQPDYATAFDNRGALLQELGRPQEAIDSHRQAITIDPQFALAYSSLCSLYEKEHRPDDLKAVVQQAEQNLPADNPELRYNQALLATMEKRYKEARDLLASLTPEHFAEQSRQRYAQLLARAYEKTSQFEQAFEQFSLANRLAGQAAEATLYDGRRYIDAALELALAWENVPGRYSWRKPPPAGVNQLAFLVGFPRSGTTLLDTILRSHAKVTVLEEQPMVNTMVAEFGSGQTFENLQELGESQLVRLREAYFEVLNDRLSAVDHGKLVIDKLPLNLASAGIIHRVFPEAPFILALRHPIDCVLSCFMQSFQLNEAMINFLSLQQAATMYDAVMRLWFAYNSVLDIPVGTIKYEELVTDLRGTAEPLLHFLGLEWDDNLLNYQQTALSRETIKTPSYNQVTQGLYTSSSYRWKHYRQQLRDIMPVLQPWAEKLGYSVEA